MKKIFTQTKPFQIVFFLLSCITIFFQVGHAQDSPPIIQYLNIEPLVVNSNEDPFSILLEIENASYDSIVITGLQSNNDQFLAISEGKRTGQVTLIDNGTGEDQQANDGIYTSPLIIWDWVGSYKISDVAHNVITAGGDILFYKNGQETGYYDISTYLTLIKFDYNDLTLPTLTKINDSIQHSSHVINIVTDQKFHDNFSSEIRNEKLDVFGDYFLNDNDELIFAYAYPTDMGNVAAFHVNYNNDVENICLPQLNSSIVDYAEGITFMAYGNMGAELFAHEYLHRYAAHCDDNGYISNGHWGPIEYSTTGFFSKGQAIEEIDSTTYLVRELGSRFKYYNDMEMYLAGLLPIDQVQFPIRYIKDAQLIAQDATIGTKTYTGELVSFDKESFLAAHGGPRIPALEPISLKTSTVVFSNRFLTPEEIFYYQFQTRRMSIIGTDNSAPFNVFRATLGRLFQLTKLTLKSQEEPSNNNDIATILETYSWINDLINTDNCTAENISVYETGPYQYIQIEMEGVKTLYNQNGEFYCQSSPNYDCLAAYNLTDLLLSGTCEDTPSMDAITDSDSMDTDDVDSELFTSYPWLEELVNECEEETVEVFQSGIYQYIYVTSDEKSELYNQDGLLYCTSAPNYDCLEAYNLTELTEEWNCDESMEDSSTGITFIGIPFFETIPWLPYLEEIRDCPGEFYILLYLLPTGNYFLVQVPSKSSYKLYDGDGNLVCIETEETDCRNEFGLSGGFFYGFSCGGNLVETTNDPSSFASLPITTSTNKPTLTVFPNPTSQQLFVQLPQVDITGYSQDKGLIRLTDLTGRVLQTTTAISSMTELDVSSLPSGVYIIHWRNKHYTTSTRVVVD